LGSRFVLNNVLVFVRFQFWEGSQTDEFGVRRNCFNRALISLVLEKDYGFITIQDILDRADIGRSIVYAHFKSKDELLIWGIHELRAALESAIQSERSRSRPHEAVIALSLAMFQPCQ
jgi:AcrR family transcriptional regulator